MTKDKGASPDGDRATHEQSPQAVSAVPVGIPSAGQRLRHFAGMLAHADGLSIKPTTPREVETTQITARESQLLQAELRAAADLLDRRGWQPIESAPRDGSPLRLYDPECDDEFGSSWDGHWTDCREDGSAGWQAGVWCNSHDCWEVRSVNPTHWMPPPEAPRP